MKAGPPQTPFEGMDENDPVMQLLAKAPLPEPDAWFVTRTLARCRAEKEEAVLSAQRVWRWVFGSGLALCLATILLVAQFQTQKSEKQKDVQDAFQFMANFDTDSDSSSSWQDSSP